MKRIKLIKAGKTSLAILGLCGLVPLCVCQNALAQLPPHSSEAKSPAASDSHQKMMGFEAQRDVYLKDAHQQLAELKNRIEVLNIKAKKSGTAARARLEVAAQNFQREWNDLEQAWGELKSSGESKWEQARNDLDASIRKLRAEIEGTSKP
ncbi:hypothetical protein [Glaciimonas sp. PCH181]|uniref:hypothetical protein n=1 Tax=Glaciimonas sp. PCH181 TaxID=2133943 RepID=UPI000D367779|nr:hypothetical protein [Glaciimonas sp. PCH181]PUA16475.1 hypothetical protein C7W93_20850 [Glaciimonas sp. PCH181]